MTTPLDRPEDPLSLARFGEVLRRIAGAADPPPMNLLIAWREGGSDNLIDWVAAQSTLEWALCITQIEAAEVIVDDVRDSVDGPSRVPLDRAGSPPEPDTWEAARPRPPASRMLACN